MGTLICRVELDKDKGVTVSVDSGDGKMLQTIVMNGKQIIVTCKGEKGTSTITQDPESIAIACKKFSVDAEETITMNSKKAFTIDSKDVLSAKSAKAMSLQTDAAFTAKSKAAATLQGSAVTVKGSSAAATLQGATAANVKATNVSINGSAKAEVKGAQVAVNGSAKVDVTAGGMASVKGALVKLG